MRQETRFKFNAYLSRVAELNGIDAGDVSKKFTVEPSVTQTLMNTMQESSDFLTRINIVPVSEMKGEKIGIGVTGSIASTTDPEMFLIGGGVARAGDVLFDPLVEHFKTYAFKSCRETPIVPAILGNDAGIYGSVRLIVGE